MDIAYAAHTDSCTFYLDDEGICRRVLRKRATSASQRGEDKSEKCLGAQYVASLDPSTDGGLVALPRVGVPMLFAYVGEGGRIALVRTGRVVRFEQHGTPDDTERPSQRETRPTLPGPDPTLEMKADEKPDSGVRPRPDEVEPVAVPPPPMTLDATMEMKAAPLEDDLEEPEEDDGARTQMFRSSRPPMMSARPAGNTPVPERPSWMPPTRIERVPIVPVAPASSTRDVQRDAETPAGTERDPALVTPRGRGMLPSLTARASRGRG